MEPVGIEEWARDHGPALLRWATRRFRDQRDAEEVVAETLSRAWRNQDQYDSDRGSPRAWLFGIARTTAADHFRRNGRHLQLVDSDDLVIDLADDDPTIERLTELSHVSDALRSLSPDHRDVIVDAYYDGLTTLEIAHRRGIPVGTVKSRLFYGLRALRDRLEEQGVIR